MTDSNDRLAKMKRRLLETEVLCQCYDLVNANATDYVTALIREWFEISDAGEFVQTDSTPLRTQDFKPMDISEIGDHLRQTHPYLFKQSAAPGVSNAATVAAPPPALSRDSMSVADRAAYIKAHGGAAYLALPETAAEARPLSEKRRSEMSIEERARLIRELGSAAYMDLPA